MNKTKQNEIFEQWIAEYKPLLFKVIHAYAGSHADKNDLFQEISFQVWRSVPSFNGNSAVSTWLYRVALNTALRWKRDERKHNDGRETFESDSHALITENQEALDDRLQWMYGEISKLDEIDRSLTLLMLDGYSYEEMADIMGISTSNVGVKIHRIKKHLINQSKKTEAHGI